MFQHVASLSEPREILSFRKTRFFAFGKNLFWPNFGIFWSYEMHPSPRRVKKELLAQLKHLA
jgi:hypothetical protein